MKKRALKLVASIIIPSFIIVTIAICRYTPYDIYDAFSPISINNMIDNSQSDFEGSERFDKSIEYFMRRWDMPGASFAIMRNDSLLYAKGYGFANVEDSVECDVNNIFRVASVSKLITAVTVMKLVEQGRVSLNSQVFGEEGIISDSLFLDIRDKNLKMITVEHLLRHTAGFSSPIGDPAFFNEGVARTIGKSLPLTMDDMVLYATKNRLRTTPGGSFDYSNLGYIVLSKVIEEVTNTPYESYVRDSILAPIGCYDMFIGRNFAQNHAPNEVKYYEVKEATPVEAYDGSGRLTMKSNGGNNVTLLGGAGGWVVSPVELLRFVASVNNCTIKSDIISPETIKLMTRNSKKYKPIGWAKVTDYEWQRSGSMAGTSALIKRQKDGYTWVFITNTSAWIGPNISNYISQYVTRAISRVKSWPKRDMFIPQLPDTTSLYGYK